MCQLMFCFDILGSRFNHQEPFMFLQSRTPNKQNQVFCICGVRDKSEEHKTKTWVRIIRKETYILGSLSLYLIIINANLHHNEGGLFVVLFLKRVACGLLNCVAITILYLWPAAASRPWPQTCRQCLTMFGIVLLHKVNNTSGEENSFKCLLYIIQTKRFLLLEYSPKHRLTSLPCLPAPSRGAELNYRAGWHKH